MIQFSCPVCKQRFSANETAAGSKMNCPCGQRLQVPAPRIAQQPQPQPAGSTVSAPWNGPDERDFDHEQYEAERRAADEKSKRTFRYVLTGLFGLLGFKLLIVIIPAALTALILFLILLIKIIILLS
jgi:hypothetical protein